MVNLSSTNNNSKNSTTIYKFEFQVNLYLFGEFNFNYKLNFKILWKTDQVHKKVQTFELKMCNGSWSSKF